MNSIISTLKKLLADELCLHQEEIGENVEFLNLGLDSITGATWIRKINQLYATKIPVTKIYSHPTLLEFAPYVKEEIEKNGNVSVEFLGDKNGHKIALQKTEGLDPISPEISEIKSSSMPIQKASNLGIADNNSSEINLNSITATLKQLLAEELYLEENQIGESTQFLELGLDSITGVTWVRKINRIYNTNIPVTKIYSHPTISELAPCVKAEAEEIVNFIVEPIKNTKPDNAIHMEEPGVYPFLDRQKDADEPSDPIKTEENIIFNNHYSNPKNSSSVMFTLKTLLAEELYLNEVNIGEHTQFLDLGLDSITGVTWVRKINKAFEIEIPVTRIYSHPTLAELVPHVTEEANKKGKLTANHVDEVNSYETTVAVEKQKNTSAEKTETHVVSGENIPNTSHEKENFSPPPKNESKVTYESTSFNATKSVAIIGMAGKFPKAKNLKEYWQNIASGKNCISEIPTDRWDINDYYNPDTKVPGTTDCKWIGALDEYDLFDPSFFNISSREAECMDPQQRLFLEACWHSIEDAGYNPMSLSGSKCGVFVGCGQGDYTQLLQDSGLTEYGLMGGANSFLAARISYFLNLQGPCLSIDTACSSSLVAIANACDSIVSGNIDQALAGGVCVMSGPSMHLMASSAGVLSKSGRCFSFDQRADGFVPGEGVGVLFLKQLEKAQKDGDMIYGVVQGWGVNQDGKTNGITAPNPKAQTRLQQDIYENYKINPEQIQLIEAHGTGTKLGDAIEVDGLKDSFSQYTQQKKYCALGSIKSNIGHCLAASGISGVIKILLALKHQQLPPSMNFEQLNEFIDIEDSPFYINTETKSWVAPLNGIRQAAISSFGLNGTNAHMVISEFPKQQQTPVNFDLPLHKPVVVPLSAKTESQLVIYTQSLLDTLDPPPFSLASLAYTFQTGRQAMNCRIAVVVDSFAALKHELQHYIQGENSSNVLRSQNEHKTDFITNTEEGREYLQKLIQNGKYKTIAKLWVDGNDVNWQGLQDPEPVQRISGLPVYPFAKERYWVSSQECHQQPVNEKPNTFSRPSASENTFEVPDKRITNQSPVSAEEKAKLFLLNLISEQVDIPREKIDPQLSYYEIGLTSHHLLKIAHFIKTDINHGFSPTRFYENSTPSDLISFLTNNYFDSISRLDLTERQLSKTLRFSAKSTAIRQSTETAPSIIPNPSDRYEPFPANDIQESFLIGRRLGVEKVGCHVYFEMEMKELDIARLNQAWQQLSEYHEMLRAVFLPNGKQQILAKVPPYEFKILDLQRESQLAREEYRKDLRKKMSHKVYEPTQWPLYEICVSVCPGKMIVHFSIDELIVDALSIQLLVKQWQKLYEESDWKQPELDISFRDYIIAIKKYEASDYFKKDLDYWMRKLSNIPQGPSLPLKAILDKPTNNEKYRRTSLDGRIDKEQWQILKNKLEKLNVSPTVFLLSVFTEVLRIWCDEDSFSIILTFFNRLLDPQLENIVAPFISTNIFIVEEKEKFNFKELIQHTQKGLFDDLDHNSVSGIRVLRELKKQRKTSNTLSIPIVFTSMLGHEIFDSGNGEESFLEKISYSITQTPQVYFDHQIHEQNGALRFRWDVAKDHYSAGAIERLFAEYCRVLDILASNFELWEKETWSTLIERHQFFGKKLLAEDNDLSCDGAFSNTIAEDLKMETFIDKRFMRFPLTDQQQAYAFGRSKHGSNISSQFYTYFDVDNLDFDRLETAMRKVMEVHDVLNIIIRQDGTQQVLENNQPYKIRVNDLRGRHESAIKDELIKKDTSMLTRLCPIGESPYFDLQVSLIDNVRSRIHFSIDLIIADGPSIILVLNTLFDFYANPDKLPKNLEITYSDYILSLQKYQKTDSYKKSFQYWKNKFVDIPPGPQLPIIEATTIHKTVRYEGILANWNALKQTAKEISVSPSMILLAVYAEVLAAWSRSESFSIVIPSWDRLPLHPDINEVVGDFTSMSWLVINRHNIPFIDKVKSYHDAVQEDLSHKAVSGLRALRTVFTKSIHKKMLTFPVVFTNLSRSSRFKVPEGFKPGNSLSQTSQVHMDNMSSEDNGKLYLYWDVAKELFPTGLMQEMFAGYQRVLECLADDPHSWKKTNFDYLINAQPEKYRVVASKQKSTNLASELEIEHV